MRQCQCVQTSAADFTPGCDFSDNTNGVLDRRLISRKLSVKLIGRLKLKYVVADRPCVGNEPLNNLLNPLPI